jgi:hypothetical protein
MCCLAFAFFGAGSFSHAASDKQDIDISFNGQSISADIQSVSLRLILETFNREKKIWFKGSEAILNTKISVRFRDLSTEEGLKKILSKVDHACFYNHNKQLVGLFVVTKGNSVLTVPHDTNDAPGKTRSPVSDLTDERFTNVKELSPGKKATGMDVSARETQSRQVHGSGRKYSYSRKKFPAPSGDSAETISEYTSSFTESGEDLTFAPNPFTRD